MLKKQGLLKVVLFILQEWKKDLWKEYVDPFLSKVNYMPLYEFIVDIYKKWDLFNLFDNAIPYFLKLNELVLELNIKSKNSLTDLLECWDNTDIKDKQFLLKSTEDIDAVKVMTIHKAKGLEFPVVLLPFAGSTGKKNNLFVSEAKNSRDNNGNLGFYYITREHTAFSSKCRTIYNTERIKSYIDEFNSLYVGMTRSQNALIIFLRPDRSNKPGFRDLFFKNEERDVIESGMLKRIRNKNHTEKSPEIKLSDICGQADKLNWLDLIKQKVEIPSEISKQRTEAENIGLIVHEILSMITQYEENELKQTIDTVVNKYGLESEKHNIENRLNTAFLNPDFLKFFQHKNRKIFIEKEIVDQKGQLTRIDRYIVYSDKIELIDFKTGEEYKKKHKKQVLEYRDLLRSFYPEKKILCYLCYIDENKIIEVS